LTTRCRSCASRTTRSTRARCAWTRRPAARDGGAPLGHAPRVVAAALAALLDEAGEGAPRIRVRIHDAPRPGANSIPMQLVRRRSLHVACCLFMCAAAC
jgi:hypothetical protein